MGERSGVGTVELAILDAMRSLGALPGRRHRRSMAVNTLVRDRLGLAPGYAYRIIVDLVQPWQLQLPLVDGHGNFGSRGDDPPASERYTEVRVSPVGQIVLAAERGELAPVPVGLINGNTHMEGSWPPFRPQGVIDAIRLAAANTSVSEAELVKVVGPPDFITGCTVSGDLAGLQAGRVAEIVLEARVRIGSEADIPTPAGIGIITHEIRVDHSHPGPLAHAGGGKSSSRLDGTVLLLDKFPPYVSVDATKRTIAERATLRHSRAHRELRTATRLRITDLRDESSSRTGYLLVCVPEQDADPEEVREQLRTVYGVSVTLQVGLPKPLATMIRQWVTAHNDEDIMASLAALEEAVAARKPQAC